ncbi:hypothetical protein TWF481_003637 [Arthrobotrys musiformis]|uniref:Uncharacterized protein n=1 Tax=Arthrobotrys musiformis TaxID=47236 RepID=A0AAV9WJ27_9PEZI
MRLRYITVICLFKQALSLDYFTNLRDLAKEPTLATGDTSEYRIPIDGETFAKWERVVDYNGLIEAFLSYYGKADREWEGLFYGMPGRESYDHTTRSTCFTERVDRLMESLFENYKLASKGQAPPVWFQNMVVEWANTLFEVVMSTRDNPFYGIPGVDPDDIPAEFLYKVAMLNRGFPENFRDALKFEDYPTSRTTADHLHLFFTPLFRGPRDPENKYGSHTKSRYEQAERYLLNAVEVSAGAGDDMQTHEFQFVVSDLDVSLEHRLVTVFVDPNKTTRMRETLLKLRDKLLRVMAEGLRQAWDIRTEMGFLDSRIAGVNKTMEEQANAAEDKVKADEQKKRDKDFAKFGFDLGTNGGMAEEQTTTILPKKRKTSLFKKWQVLKDLIIDLTYMPEFLIKDLDAMAEILRVLEVPQLPSTEPFPKLPKTLTSNSAAEQPKYMRISNIETMDSPINQVTSTGGYTPINQNTSPGGYIPLQKPQVQDIIDATFQEEPGVGIEPEVTDREFEDLINVIPISLDLRAGSQEYGSQQEVELMRAGSDPVNNAENFKLLSTDVSPSARSLLHPGYSPSSRNYSPPRRSKFSGTGSRFSDVINNDDTNK